MRKADYIKTKIIKWLIESHLSFNVLRDAIGSEVLFSTGRRKADILILSRKFHALEIKGDFDTLRKLKGQLSDYHKTFDKVSIVTTPKHLSKIRQIIKPNTGLILFDQDDIRIIKRAKTQKKLDKRSLLMFLPKKELLRLLKIRSKKSYIGQIRNNVTNKLTGKAIRKAAYQFLLRQHKENFNLFLKDIGDSIPIDELKGLSGKIDKLSI